MLSARCLFRAGLRSRIAQHVVRFQASNATNQNANVNTVGKPPPGPSVFESFRAAISGAIRDPEYMIEIRKRYGDVARLWIGQPFVLVYDPELFMQVLRREWSLPYGAAPESWPTMVYYKKRSPDAMPMMLLRGEEWKKPRHTIQQHFFSHGAVDGYQPGIANVVEDAVRCLHENPVPDDLNHFMCNVSFEMLAQVLLDRRMGLLDGSSGPDERRFVDSAVVAFHVLGDLILRPPMSDGVMLQYMPGWKEFETNMDSVWDIGMKWLEEAEETLPEAALVSKLSNQGAMNRKERLVNLVTILQAGVDTTSNSLAWVAYELARRPKEQSRLREELRRVLPDEESFQREMLPNLPYMKAFLREVQRLSPTVAETIWRFPFDIEMGEYAIKRNSMIMCSAAPYSMDEEFVGNDPELFLPERWLASDSIPKDADPRKPVSPPEGGQVMTPAPILSHPLLATPFGVGPRMCVGARVAQNEIHTFVSRICRDFTLTLDFPHQEIRSIPKLVNTPDLAPRIRFEPV